MFTLINFIVGTKKIMIFCYFSLNDCNLYLLKCCKYFYLFLSFMANKKLKMFVFFL
ncbi:hypothetical protein AAJ76_4000151724 [Vairimorpha ceranae]|uniref:Uncharacterized protein n=1 Tax=Vairimorpha ceranae TaxID=40302 RepID=A0A0F9ZGJ5_9MICR|nr:hypothetical protein AAJ76_4000151724 [Vairimorpha ceranae]KKO76379.1 hypothetical protein AAJ76_4000151724 [Vairimorpha ceranae]